MSLPKRSRIHVTLVGLALLASLACERSPRRPTVVPAQPPAEKTAVPGQQPDPDVSPSPVIDEQQESELPGVTPSESPSPSPSPSASPDPDTPDTDPGSGDSPPTDTTTTTPGTDDLSKWDGQSFKGNDKWDVSAAP